MKKIIWKKIVSRGRHPLILIENASIVMPKLLAKELGINLHFHYWKRYGDSAYCLEKEFEKAVLVFLNIAEKSPKYLLKIINKANKNFTRLISLSKKLSSQNFNNVKLKDLQKQVKQFYNLFYHSCVYIYVPFMVEEALTKIICEELIRKYGVKEDEVESFVSKLINLPRLTESLHEKSDLWDIVKFIKKREQLKIIFIKLKQSKLINKLQKEKFYNNIVNHQKRYAWIKCYFYLIRSYTINEIIKNIQRILKVMVNPLGGYMEEKQIHDKLIKNLKIKGKLLKIIQISQEWMFFRQNRLEKLSQILYYINPFLSGIGKRLGISYDELIQLRVPEIVSGKFKKSDIKARKKGCALIIKSNKVNVIIDKKLKEFLEQERNIFKTTHKLINGVVAQRGKAKGRVRIGTPYSFHDLKRGDVLVTAMTTPEATPFLKRVAAIITDEGGITCHAAIVSRELGIPCIIGTKIATQMLKNGDLVDVDADKGLVKKL